MVRRVVEAEVLHQREEAAAEAAESLSSFAWGRRPCACPWAKPLGVRSPS